MKVGILTLHYIPNYGSVLQSHALQQVLGQYFEAEIIDYKQADRESCFSTKGYYYNFISNPTIGKIIKYPYRRFEYRWAYRLRKSFEKFYVKSLIMSKELQLKDLVKGTQQYAAIVVGSDQVWNPTVLNGNYSLLLDFYKGRKFSYASSIGVNEIPKELSNIYYTNLASFEMLSCREQEGTDSINTLLKYERCERVLDPTLLLDNVYWSNFEKRPDKEASEPFIFLYFAREDDNIVSFAQRIAKETKLRLVIAALPRVYNVQKELHNLDCKVLLQPEEWVWYINHADIVVTNSFHGLAFSINMNTQCYIYLKESSIANSRIKTLVDLFGLQDNVYTESKCNFTKSNISYKEVNNTLRTERQRSMDYILRMKKALENNR